MSELKELLENTIEEWKGNEPQIDDIVVIGIKLQNNNTLFDSTVILQKFLILNIIIYLILMIKCDNDKMLK